MHDSRDTTEHEHDTSTVDSYLNDLFTSLTHSSGTVGTCGVTMRISGTEFQLPPNGNSYEVLPRMVSENGGKSKSKRANLLPSSLTHLTFIQKCMLSTTK